MRRLALFLIALVVAGLGVFWFASAPARVAGAGDRAIEAPGDAALGRVVFLAGGCASCHATLGQDNPLRLGGGLQMKSDFGVLYAPNISPHKGDGIGVWTNADLANAMLRGVSPAGAHYYPAFPYTSYAGMTLDDVRHLMAYIRTLEPVEGGARENEMRFPFNIRRTLGVWKRLYLDATPVTDDPARDASWNRGRYLVETLGHCAECHSPRNALGAVVGSMRHAGGPEPQGKGWVPNITPHALKNWTRGDWVELLKAGVNADGDDVGGSMAAVVRNTSQIPASDIEAMADYLLTLPPRDGPARSK